MKQIAYAADLRRHILADSYRGELKRVIAILDDTAEYDPAAVEEYGGKEALKKKFLKQYNKIVVALTSTSSSKVIDTYWETPQYSRIDYARFIRCKR